VKAITRLSLLGSVVFLVWAAVAVLHSRWLLVAILTSLWLLALKRTVLAGLAGFGVALYVGEAWPAVAFALLVAGRVASEGMPLWAQRRSTDPRLLLAAVSAVDPRARYVLANAAYGMPISTVTLAVAAAAEAPQAWQDQPGSPATTRWDGSLLVDAHGARWTSHAAEAVVLGGRLAASGIQLPALQAFGTAALLVPETALADALRLPSDAYETAIRIAGFNVQDLSQILLWVTEGNHHARRCT